MKNIDNHNWYFDNTYAKLPPFFYSIQSPIQVAKPEVVLFNKKLAEDMELGFLNDKDEDLAGYFSGNKIPYGAEPLAQAYAGHQFEHFTMLGDGRAILLGEQLDPKGKRFDIQLKGSGRTPYSRRGDGRATLYSMLREYLISEAMHHLNIPTTRSLAVVSTGEKVRREVVHNGAILTRVADSHIRVGTFEYASYMGSLDNLKELTAYTINRHYPDLKDSDNPALDLLEAVMYKQIDLIINWMRVGFIHGVMNTDNMSISGETIDYGPCAFMNSYNPNTVFSSIDTGGRYAFDNQPTIGLWNLSALGNALLPMISENQNEAINKARGVLDKYQDAFSEKWYDMMFSKLGILHPEEKEKKLVDNLLSLMEKSKSDYTQLFLALQEDKKFDGSLSGLQEFNDWKQQWKYTYSRNENNQPDLMLMRKLNPKIIPRNHWVEDALDAATSGDMSPFNKLLNELKKPYDNHPSELQYEVVPLDFDEKYKTYCGT